jgi:surface protein
MFAYCSSLTSLDLSNFNTENVTWMTSMFIHCSSLTSLDLTNYNTANVTRMDLMFYGCSSLTSLDLSHFDMSSVTNKSYMCYGLATTSGACTITCPLAVETQLQSGTNLPTSGVTFTWVRPTSK